MMFAEMVQAQLYPPQYQQLTQAANEAAVVTLLNEERPPVWTQVSDWIDRNGPIRNSDLRRIAEVDIRFPMAWRGALAQGTLALVSATAGAPRLTAELAAQRNELVASLARCCVVAHAAQGGMLASQVSQWQGAGRSVEWLTPVR